jgi:hypothetical protein
VYLIIEFDLNIHSGIMMQVFDMVRGVGLRTFAYLRVSTVGPLGYEAGRQALPFHSPFLTPAS